MMNLYLFNGRGLVSGLLCGDVVRPSHPGQDLGVLLAPLGIRLVRDIIFQKSFIFRIQSWRKPFSCEFILQRSTMTLMSCRP